MLSRVAARSLRIRPTRKPFTYSLSLLQDRSYAKNNRPRKPDESRPRPHVVPSSTAQHGPNAQRIGEVARAADPEFAPSASGKTSKSTGPDYSTRQDEFMTGSGSKANTEPSLEHTGPGRPKPSDAKPSTSPDYSTLQDEFDSGSSSMRNTTPQDTSPSAIDPADTRKKGEEVTDMPLPDLTKGIPSTLDAELSEASMKSKPEDLNITENADVASGAGRGGGIPKSDYISSVQRRRDRFANYMYLAFFGFALTGTIYLGRDWESEEERVRHVNTPSGWGFGLFYGRTKARLSETMNFFNEPAFTKLLPDPDPMFERPYTLVLNLEDLLVHSEWSREHGWRMAKRPGVDYFLRYLSQYYELVIWTTAPSFNADPIIRKLDPFRVVLWPLFREATRYQKGEYIKDLSYLNRPLSKIIIMDTEPAAVQLQPENAVLLPKWTGQPNDSELVSYIPFLEYVAAMGLDDTRSAIASFSGKHVPSEFAHRTNLAREKFQKQLADERAKRPKRSGVGFFGNALGIKQSAQGVLVDEQGQPQMTLSEGFEQGKMLQDQIRERGQKQYEMIDREIRENGEKWLKEMAAEEEKMKEQQVKGMQTGVQTTIGSLFGGGGGGGGGSGVTASS